MAKIDGGEMIVRSLEREGVREIFTLHGGHLDAIYAACMRHDFRVIDTRHEQAAAHMADGWARTTGRPGVALVTAGPGVTDAVTGVANAFMDSIPMVLIGGRSPLSDDDRLPLQAVDQMGIMRPITKWARSVAHTDRIPEYVAAAFRHAVSGRPGPVFLELPIDVLFSRVDETSVTFPEKYRPLAAPSPSRAALRQALDWVKEADRPAILAGGGVWFSQGATELVQFAELTHTPVMTNSKARGAIPEDHALSFGGFGAIHPAVHAKTGVSADLVILLGTRIGLFTGGRNSVIPADARVIQVDIEPEEIGRNRDIELGIVADCREFLRDAIEAAGGHKFDEHREWRERLAAIRTAGRHRFDDALKLDSGAIHPARMAHEIANLLDPEAIVVADGGETASWMGNAWTARHPGRFLSHGYLGCLGIGLPFAMAAKAAHPDRQVFCIIGDGSAGLNFAEFHTAAKNNLPITVVINNDKQWGMSKHGQELMWGKGRHLATELGMVHYEHAAEGLGAHGELVERAEDIAPAMKRALGCGRVACVNIVTDPEVIEPGTLALYSAGASRPRKEEPAAAKEAEGTTLPYYGKRKLD
ncbi:MAG TPA: thiamine pyrophosphate-binding protein [Candidatus Binataceae bacterium]|nr:thiamine pyrophosphate-binding protein [Candidatus Binataceae bacterium]